MGAQKTDRRWLILAGFALLAAAIVAAVLIPRGGGEDESSKAAVGANGCKKVEKPAPKEVELEAPEESVEPGEEITAVVQTSCGSFDIALDTKEDPKIANSFAFLAEEGFYDETTFHRIVPEFVIQGGDPLGNGSGGPGYSVVEAPPANFEYAKGTVAMAKSAEEAAGTAGSQFYIVTGPQGEELPPEYAVAGKVSKGLDVVEKIGKMGKPGTEEPKQTILIESITIERG